jgi:hypothetical protein
MSFRWKGKQEANLFRDTATRGVDALVVLDVDQLADPDLCRALKASGLHHISLRQGRRVKGRTGVARVIASLVVAMPYILADLKTIGSSRFGHQGPFRDHRQAPSLRPTAHECRA